MAGKIENTVSENSNNVDSNVSVSGSKPVHLSDVSPIAAVAKAVLNGVGYAMTGAAKGMTGKADIAEDLKNAGAGVVKQKGTSSDKAEQQIPDSKDDEKEIIVHNAEENLKNDSFSTDAEKNIKSNDSFNLNDKFNEGTSKFGSTMFSDMAKKQNTLSDENLKNIYGDAMTDSLLENFSKIAAIDFTYKPEAQSEYQGNANVDDKEHIGVKAQELEANPVTASTVETDEHGNKVVNTDQLAMADTAVIAEMSRRILTLEVAVKELLAKTRG